MRCDRIFFAALLAGALLPVSHAGRKEHPHNKPIPAASDLKLLPGFRAELLYRVPKKTQGTWVSLTIDDRGRLIASAERGRLYRIVPAPVGADPKKTRVELIDIPLGNAQGLQFASGSLYAVVNGRGVGGNGTGLYRARDTDGDDRFDEVKRLKTFTPGHSHGPHGVVLGPDGRSLYIAGGNFTRLPEGIARSRVPRVWAEDHLLPRYWTPDGFSRGKLAPGGWVGRTDLDGRDWELVCTGLRNHYDLAFSPEGELFTYDSDMERDEGLPWYRPTRICHLVSGADYGWRSGSGKWPAYHADSLPPVAEIGLGSPTGMIFGTGTRYPARYQRALYAFDWSYGKIYAVHLKPNGASYGADVEVFATGEPFPVTDAVIGPDGAMYFTVGGRGTHSGLYRITYVGGESTVPVRPAAHAAAAKARALRRTLESFHGRADPAVVARVWPHLRSEDRWVRSAARIALEHQDVKRWQDRALSETNPNALIAAMVALARVGDRKLQPRLLRALGRLDFKTLRHEQRRDYLRACSLAFIRMGRPDRRTAATFTHRLEPHYPSGDEMTDRELARMLAYLDASRVIPVTLDLLEKATEQEQQIHLAWTLRNLRYGWTVDQRKRYFAWFGRARRFRGGVSLRGYLKMIRADAIKSTPEAQRALLAAGANRRNRESPPPPKPIGPGRAWTAKDLTATARNALHNRNFANGKRAFAAALCASCHRFDGEGGDVGPDLTAVRGRFGLDALIESIIEPSKEVNDQYPAWEITKRDGSRVVGRIVGETDEALEIATDPFKPDARQSVPKREIRRRTVSKVSLMPPALLHALNRDEALDLLAYLLSRGDPNDPMYK